MQPRPRQLLDYREYPVLYVDDEPENLRIFELTFRREFSVVTAGSGAAGLEILNSRPIALLLSDHRMPGMSGVEFLARARALDPRTLRFLVTAYGDAETLQAAINDGSIYRFVPKPWEPDELRVAMRRGIEVYALERERERLLRELTMLNRVSKSIDRELDEGPLLDLLLEIATREFHYDAATLLLFEGSEKRLGIGRCEPRDAELARRLAEIRIDPESAPEFCERLLAGEIQLLAQDAAARLEPPVRHWVTEVAAQEVLVVPLVGAAGALGALAVDNRRGGDAFQADDHSLLEGLASQAVVAIENARLGAALRRSREQVQQAERLASFGTLAAGLAHEIDDPLVFVRAFLHAAPQKRNAEDEAFWTEGHERVSRDVQRIRDLVATIGSLGRGVAGAPQREWLEPGPAVAEVVRLLDAEAERAGVVLRADVAAQLPKLLASRSQLQLVVANLVRNAIQASPRGAAVVLRVASGAERGLALEVSDQGPGIPKEQLERILDPFPDARDAESGKGLGLVICQQIVAEHGGSLSIRSEGRGCTVLVQLPPGGDAPAPAP